MLYRGMTLPEIAHLSDDSLTDAVKRTAGRERAAMADLVALLAEFDARRLYLAQGCSSLFVYCTRVLHLSEHAAYGRIEAARLSRRVPLVLDRLAAGELTLTAACLLTPVLTTDNHREVLDDARHRTKREVEQLVASRRPRPPAPTIVRKLPARPHAVAPSPEPDQAAPAMPKVSAPAVSDPPPPGRRPLMAPLSSEHYRLQVTISREAHDHLRCAQDLLRHVIPTGDPAAIVERALAALVERLSRAKLGEATRPRPQRAGARRTRGIPRAVRRAVWARDNGQCAFVGAEGRCAERGFLEFHHVVPHADGGEATVDGIQLRCRAHNQYEAVLWDGGGGWVREVSAVY